jgi:O-antigen ligase
VSEIGYWAIELTLVWVALKGRREALMILAFSLPLSRRLPALPVSGLNYQNLIILIVLISCLRDSGKEKGGAVGVRHWIPLVILTILFTAAFANTALTFVPDFYPGLWDPYRNMLVYKSLITCFAFYFIVSHFIRSREDLLAVVRASVFGIIVEGSYTAFEFLVLTPGRVSGHMAESNSMGAFLACSFVIIFGLAVLLPRTYPQWRVLAAGTILTAIGLLGTLSRGAWVAALAGFGVVSAWVSRTALVLGIAAIAMSSLWLPEKVQHRLDETFIRADQENWKFKDGQGDEESALLAMVSEQVASEEGDGVRLDTSLQGRLVIWDAAARMMMDYPLGVGFGVFPWYLHHYSSVLRWKATHNIYMKTGTEAGLPTLVTFLILIFLLCHDAFRAGRMKEDPEMRAFGVGMLGYIIALSASAAGVDVYFQVEVNGQFWCLAAAVSQAVYYPLRAGSSCPVPADPSSAASRPLYELVT